MTCAGLCDSAVRFFFIAMRLSVVSATPTFGTHPFCRHGALFFVSRIFFTVWIHCADKKVG